MVQITNARIDMGGQGRKEDEILVRASDYDPQIHGDRVCRCPDENCTATLVRHATHYKKHYHPFTGEPMRLKIPDYYQRGPHAPQHSPGCTEVERYYAYQAYARTHGGLSLGHGGFVFNLNILHDSYPAPLRNSTPDVNAAFVRSAPDRSSIIQEPRDSRKLSQGINSTQMLARLIEETAFNAAYRESIVLTIGKKHYTLAQIFQEDSLKFFRECHAHAKNKTTKNPAAVLFKPIPIAAKRGDDRKISHVFHDSKMHTIQGQAASIMGSDGQEYYVSILLHCGTDDIYKELKQDIAQGVRSYLLYTEDAYVDLMEFAQKKSDIRRGSAKDNTVFVHVPVNRPEQIYAWNYREGAPRLDIDMGIQRRPSKEIPPELIQH